MNILPVITWDIQVHLYLLKNIYMYELISAIKSVIWLI